MFASGKLLLRTALFLLVLPSCEASSQGTCEVPSFPPAGNADGGNFNRNKHRQYIIPTMNFTGCGVITNWTIVGVGRGGKGTRDRITELQLFRPDPTRSTVFTKVTSSVVTTSVPNNTTSSHTFTSIGFTFSPGDVLGFYYPKDGPFLAVRRTASFSTHSVLTSVISNSSTVTASVVTLTATVTRVPLMSVAVSCMECPRSTTILPSVTTSTTPILTDILSSSETLPLLPFTSSSQAITSSVTTDTVTVSSSTATVTTDTVTVSSSTATVTTDTVTVSSSTATMTTNTVTVPSSTATVTTDTVTVFQSMIVSAPSSQSLFISGSSLSERTLSSGVPGTTTVPDVSDEVPIAVMAGGTAGGALAVLLIVIVVLIAVISGVICIRRKNVKYVLDAQPIGASREPVTFSNPLSTFDSVGNIVQTNTYEMSDNVYFEIPNNLDHKPCSTSENVYQNISRSSYEVSNSKIFENEGACRSRLTDTPCEGHKYYEPDQVLKGREPPPLLPRKVPAQSMYSRVPTREERLRSPEPGSDENVYESPLVHFETLGGQKSFENGIPEGIYEMSFCKEEIYCSPSEDEDGVYSQMAQWGYQEVPRASVTLSKKLGEGQFGEVYKAELKVSKERSLDVAVKLVKKGAPAEETIKLLQEAATLGQFKHRHVVRLIGVVTVEEPTLMLMELLPGGDLKDYLDSVNTNPSQLSSPDLPSLLLQFCKQVVDGLACLSQKSFVHRDIAARNILLDKDLNCKISDFGMTRGVEEDTYYMLSKGGKIPAKWTSPEALLFKKYSTSSDVWSYGMLMYEIWSLGHKPFEDKTIQEMIKCLDERYCLPPPPGCPRAVYEVMVKCWNPSHNNRPTASDISGEFCKSERILLSWKKEDIVSPSAQVLGGPLSEGEELHKDLQFLYREK